MVWEGMEEIGAEVEKWLNKKVVNVFFLCPYFLHKTSFSRGQVSVVADAVHTKCNVHIGRDGSYPMGLRYK